MQNATALDRSGSDLPGVASVGARRFPRREALSQLTAGTLLSLGLWPGTLRADNHVPAGSFRFLVVNDTHCLSPECGSYLQGVINRMKREEAEFCLHAGDLTEKGEIQYFKVVQETFRPLGCPFFPVIGNHDYQAQTDRTAYLEVFPQRVNYQFSNRGWQFLGLDSSDGLRYDKTSIQPATLRWLDEQLPRLNRRKPTVVFTHFPLGVDVPYRPFNADALLDRFRDFNLQAVFSGHYHGFTERVSAGVVLTTNRCCALKRGNHDGTKQKGYFLCCAQEGKIIRSFVEHLPG